ncbi:vacuolar metal resistance ABC transporter-like protein [Setomelanomma holmii]|uniref:Vacuolar metal resistance ABC transporter-like protein n=1 Tax=Setomelanomma holmii TaxID=210430 RepID=A0A9P4GXJ8_9PLEO|nr:vacuolar metal resistance ABC transporter-like protein [Setomelanomma holmii]
MLAQHSYLDTSNVDRHPFCGDGEGWGPISPMYLDFTPCFVDTWVVVVAAFGLLGCAGALWYLCLKSPSHSVRYDRRISNKMFGTNIFRVSRSLLEHSLSRPQSKQRSKLHTRKIYGLQISASGPTIILVFWSLFLVTYAVKLHSLITRKIYREHAAYFGIFCASFGLAILEFVLEWLGGKPVCEDAVLGANIECLYEHANICSILTFSWITQIMERGNKITLAQDDLPNLSMRDTTKDTTKVLGEAWKNEVKKKHPSLWQALFNSFGGLYARGAAFKALLRRLIRFVGSHRTESPPSVAQGAVIAIAMFAYHQYCLITGMRIKSSLTASIYCKSTRLSKEGLTSKSTGDLVNYMAIDTERIQRLAEYGQLVWSVPFQIVLCIVSLYQLLGRCSLVGIATMMVTMPVNRSLAQSMATLQKEQMQMKDTRTNLIAEILSNMKSIKIYSWTTAFKSRLNFIRAQELKTIRKIGAINTVSAFVWYNIPFFVACSSFSIFVLTQHRPLTTERVFAALTLFNLLTVPLAAMPIVVTAVVDANISVARIISHWTADEVQDDAVTCEEATDATGEELVCIRDASFAWDKKHERRMLHNINISAKRGELVCVVGRVGAGKSSLLQAVLGDLWKISGEVIVRGKTAYVSQSSWVMNTSVRANIVFGHHWDPQFYKLTIKACALSDDFAFLPDGDQTEVGERGVSLSGGQKARISLARAVYSRAGVYLLDDCLSAVDQHVGRHLIDNVLGPRGLLANKTRILATNSIPVLMEASSIVFLRKGSITERGSYNQLMTIDGDMANMIKASMHGNQRRANTTHTANHVTNDQGSNVRYSRLDSFGYNEGQLKAVTAKGSAAQQVLTGNNDKTAGKHSSNNHSLVRATSFEGFHGRHSEEESNEGKMRQLEESPKQGKVDWSVYGEYARSSNLAALSIYLLLLLGGQITSVGANLWVKSWSAANELYGRNPFVGKYIGIYFAFGIGSAALLLGQVLILWIFCSVEASRKLHERMASALFHSPMSFFETTPSGRVLNRFSNDIYSVDALLALNIDGVFENSFRAGFILIIISSSTPMFMTLVFPLGALYLYIQRYYLRTSRELKRLDSVSRSPIYAHFHESLSGMSTIRAYRQQKRFEQENECRMDANHKAYLPSFSATRWLAIRLECTGSVIVLAAAVFAIISVANHSSLSAGMVGLTISYALQAAQSLSYAVQGMAEVEVNMVSVERVLEYANLPSEAPEVIPENRPPASWPSQGGIEFNNYSTRYRPGLDLVLSNINLQIKAGEKIGVVGRTGAGKSSLTLALFRIIEPAEGFMSIDGLNTSTIGLLDLRKKLSIIPQDAALFEGTVRDNIDPDHTHDDTELWSVLEQACLKDYISSMPGGLDAQLHEGGSNLSIGQRQLISLARALLASSKILILDEATAAVDVETDAMLQTTLRGSTFRNKTIITIAHRINTIIDSDRIIVLSQGGIAEFDTPTQLMRQKGLFYELVRESNSPATSLRA